MTIPTTFDIVRMNREVAERVRRKQLVHTVGGLLLVGLGLARRRLLGLGLAVAGLNMIAKQLTGGSLLEFVRHRAESRKKPEPTTFGNGRDAVDQASWESFPASDPPGY